jgi:hypothetical protein
MSHCGGLRHKGEEALCLRQRTNKSNMQLSDIGIRVGLLLPDMLNLDYLYIFGIYRYQSGVGMQIYPSCSKPTMHDDMREKKRMAMRPECFSLLCPLIQTLQVDQLVVLATIV